MTCMWLVTMIPFSVTIDDVNAYSVWF